MSQTEYELKKSEVTEEFIRQINQINKEHTAPYIFEDDVLALAKTYVVDMDRIKYDFIQSNNGN